MKQELPKSIAVIVGDLFGDVQKLIQQEALLIKQNILMKVSLCFILLFGGFWLSLFLAFFLIDVAGLPTWSSCAIVGLLLCGFGAYGILNNQNRQEKIYENK